MKPGDIVLVKFPFSDSFSSKKRPALLLRESKFSSGIHLITIAMISSRVDKPHFVGDVLLQDWSKANLLHPSLVRLAKIATLDFALVEKVLGVLAEKDLKAVKKNFKLFFENWL